MTNVANVLIMILTFFFLQTFYDRHFYNSSEYALGWTQTFALRMSSGDRVQFEANCEHKHACFTQQLFLFVQQLLI